MKTSVKPTSENHHQSVTRAIMLEKKMKNRAPTPMKAQENNFAMRLYLLYHNVI
jgi:hypothetical protein